MRTFNALSHRISAFATLAMFAGCSGNNPPMVSTTVGQDTAATNQPAYQPVLQNGRFSPAAASRRGSATRQRVTAASFFNRQAAGKPLVFISDDTNNVVDIYLQGGKNKMVGQITGLNSPYGLAADAGGDLYVANLGGTTLPVYAPNYTKEPKLILNDGVNLAGNVAVSPQGVVGLVNWWTAPCCHTYADSVSFFAKNLTQPCVTVVADPATFQFIEDGAFDDKGNFYIDGLNANRTEVFGEIVGGCKAKTIRTLTTGNTIGSAYSIRIDRGNRIAILDAKSNTIDTYDAPKKGTLGNPVSTTPLSGGPSGGPFAFALLASGRDLYAAFYKGGSQPGGAALEYDYPAGGVPEKAVPLPVPGTPVGLAVTPPLLP